MATIRLATATAVRGFQNLSAALSSTTSGLGDLVDQTALEDEFGRLRVWSGNLGALQKGHSSADYRLRDSPLLLSNALKLLKELDDNLSQSVAVVTGARLPYELQARAADSEGEDDDGFYSEDSDDDSDTGAPKTELGQRFREVVDIIDNLYKLSVRIRQPTLKTRSLKAASYRPKDPSTGVDVLEQYAAFDLQHTRELVAHLRSEHTKNLELDNDVLIERLSKAITLRRRQFKYWRRHRDKLGDTSVLDERPLEPAPVAQRPVDLLRHDTLEAQSDEPVIAVARNAVSEKTGKTLLSGTEATQHHQSLDEIVDNKSVTSYATTVRDLSGKGIELPPPPKAASGEKDFECPYCFIICPARYGYGRAWKTHLLQDLQPYICTYPECESAEQLFRSRREWSEHEASHRKAWRCPEHPHAVFRTRTGLEEHLRHEHADSFPENQLDSIVKVGETSTVDLRENCPICFAVADMEGIGSLQNHIAHHLERFASFSLPKTAADDESDAGSSMASRGARTATDSSQRLSESLSSISSYSHDERDEVEGAEDIPLPDSSLPAIPQTQPTGALLSAETLGNVPDHTKQRLDFLMSGAGEHEEQHGNEPREGDQSPPHSMKEKVVRFDHEDSLGTEERRAFQKMLNYFYGELINLKEPKADGTARTIIDYFVDLPSIADYPDYLEITREPICMRHIKEKIDEHQYVTIKQFSHDIITMCNNARAYFGEKSKMYRDADRIEEECMRLLQEAVENPEQYPEIHHFTFFDFEDESDSTASFDSGDDAGLVDDSTPLLTASELRTLRDLYQSRELLQRDQSYTPNVAYNEIISLCQYDITRLKVDAIVNSANRWMKITRMSATLNHIVHRAAGPMMRKECRTVKKGTKPGQVRLTKGWALPCQYVIHAARPQFEEASKSLKVLEDCYRNALKTAMDFDIKTIAFPCLGAGGCGFPSKLAARVALQEVRDFLDKNPDHGFERIIFCTFDNEDQKSYKDFIPVYFPPSHRDREDSAFHAELRKYVAVAEQLREAHAQVDKISELLVEFDEELPSFPSIIINNLGATLLTLDTVAWLFEHAKEPLPRATHQVLADIDLFCSAVQAMSVSFNEMAQAMQARSSEDYRHWKVWDELNSWMKSKHDLDVQSLVKLCHDFLNCLDVILLRAGEPYDMQTARIRLDRYRQKQTAAGHRSFLDSFDSTPETQKPLPDVSAQGPSTVRVTSLLSLAQLYRLGKLTAEPTNAIPSARALSIVCFAREDLTRLEVDVIVNSTDPGFMGMGTLDRTVFRRGGPRMLEDIVKFKNCPEGSVRTTPGHSLPAKHVVHVIPPENYRTNSKHVFRRLYRDALFTASSLKATSVALPSIGTGALGYPMKDAVSIAIEEVKRFLESTDHNSTTIRKIIFCVFGSADEKMYSSLLPHYFPPLDMTPSSFPPQNFDHTRSTSDGGLSSASGETSLPRRNLFSSIGEAFRNVRFGRKDKAININAGGALDSPSMADRPRALRPEEEQALLNLEDHAQSCPECNDVIRIYSEGRNLCAQGYAAAQLVLQFLQMDSSQKVWSTYLEDGKRVTVDVPQKVYPHSWNLLVTVEKSFRDGHSSRPFVSPNQPYSTAIENADETPPDVTIHTAEVTIPSTSTQDDEKNSKRLLSTALRKAADAVSLDNAHNVEGAIEAYASATRLLEQVIEQKSNKEDVMKLATIRTTYMTRMEELRQSPLFATIHTLKAPGDTQLKQVSAGDCRVNIFPGKVEVYDRNPQTGDPKALVILDLDPETALIKSKDVNVALRSRTPFHFEETRIGGDEEIVFRCRDRADCDRLFQRLKQARRSTIKSMRPADPWSDFENEEFPPPPATSHSRRDFGDIGEAMTEQSAETSETPARNSKSAEAGALPQEVDRAQRAEFVSPQSAEIVQPSSSSAPQTRERKFKALMKIFEIDNIPTNAGSSYIEWRLCNSNLAEHSGRTRQFPIRNRQVVYDYETSFGVGLKVDENNVLEDCVIEFDIFYDKDDGEENKLGIVRRNLSHYDYEYLHRALFVVEDCKIRNTLSIGISMKLIEGVDDFSRPASATVRNKPAEQSTNQRDEPSQSSGSDPSQKLPWMAKRPSDDIVEQEFQELLQKPAWRQLPDVAKRKMEAYDITKKWTLVYQDKLAHENSEKEKEAVKPDNRLELPSAPSHAPRRRSSGLFSLFKDETIKDTPESPPLNAPEEGSRLPQKTVTREQLDLADRMLALLREEEYKAPERPLYKDVAQKLAVDTATAADIANYLAELGLVQTSADGYGWVQAVPESDVKSEQKGSEAEERAAEDIPEAAPGISKAAERLLFLLSPLIPGSSLGPEVELARKFDLDQPEFRRPMQELESLGIVYSEGPSKTAAKRWYSTTKWGVTSDSTQRIAQLKLPEGEPPLWPAERDLAKRALVLLCRSRRFEANLAHELGSGPYAIGRALQHLQSLGLAKKTPKFHRWTVVEDPAERRARLSQQPSDEELFATDAEDEDGDEDSPPRHTTPTLASEAGKGNEVPKISVTIEPSRRGATEEEEDLERSNSFERDVSAAGEEQHTSALKVPPTNLDEFFSYLDGENEAPDSSDQNTTRPQLSGPDAAGQLPSNPIPPGARWTQLDRRIVTARALDEANERYEQHEDTITVLRVLSREEIQALALRSMEIREGKMDMVEMAKRAAGDDVKEEEDDDDDEEDMTGKGKGKEQLDEAEVGSETRTRRWRRRVDARREFGKKTRDLERGFD